MLFETFGHVKIPLLGQKMMPSSRQKTVGPYVSVSTIPLPSPGVCALPRVRDQSPMIQKLLNAKDFICLSFWKATGKFASWNISFKEKEKVELANLYHTSTYYLLLFFILLASPRDYLPIITSQTRAGWTETAWSQLLQARFR